MIVVSDTSPLNYLIIIGAVDVLPVLFNEVYAPPEVIEELQQPRAPDEVQRWAQTPPSWLRVIPAKSQIAVPNKLGPGETQAIALAKELHATRLLIDERDGAKFATEQGLMVIGTLAVLELAADRKLLDLPIALGQLKKTTFRISDDLVRAALARDASRGKSPT